MKPFNADEITIHSDPPFFSPPDRMTATEVLMKEVDQRVLDIKNEVFQIEKHLNILKSLLLAVPVQETVNIQEK